MKRPLAFILTCEETFTPTHSGAIATHTYACCRQAQQAGIEPIVLARPSEEAAPYADVEALLFAAPATPADGPALTLRRIERRLRHWTQLRHGEYVKRTVAALKQRGLDNAALIVHNDPELTVDLRRHFPDAVLIHWFHNQQTCKPRPRKQFAQAVDAAIAVSEYTRQWAIEHYGLTPSGVHRVYNGVDLESFHPRQAEANGHEPVINFTGRTGVEKGPDLLLAAGLELVRRNQTTGFSIQMIGANHWGRRTMDAYQQKLDDLANQLRSEGIAVHMPGHLDRRQTADQMRQADIHVVPARWDEPFGLSTVEGMASGLATVGSRTGGTPEIIADDGLPGGAGDSPDGCHLHGYPGAPGSRHGRYPGRWHAARRVHELLHRGPSGLGRCERQHGRQLRRHQYRRTRRLSLPQHPGNLANLHRCRLWGLRV